MSRHGKKAAEVALLRGEVTVQSQPMFTDEQFNALRTWIRAEIIGALGTMRRADNAGQLRGLADGLFADLPRVFRVSGSKKR